MVKFTNFCGIFATVFILTTTVIIASCSQDDDYYESDMYTLAEKMETRSGGDPGTGGGGIDNTLYEATCSLSNVKFYTTPEYMGSWEESCDILVNARWREGGILNNCVEYKSGGSVNLDNIEVTNGKTSSVVNGLIYVTAYFTAQKIVLNDSVNDTVKYDTLLLYAKETQSVPRSNFHPVSQ